MKNYIKKYYHIHFKFYDAQNHFYLNKTCSRHETNPEDLEPPLVKKQRVSMGPSQLSQTIFENNFMKYTDPYTLKTYTKTPSNEIVVK